MNIDDDKTDALVSAGLRRRSVFVRSLAVGCVLASLVTVVHAGGRGKDEPRPNQQAQQRERVQERPRQFEHRQEQRQPEQRQPEQRQPEARQYEQRQFDGRAFEARNEEQRRQMQMQEQNARAEALRRNGRMTADERRDLRRQINEAGLDIYPNTPRR
jgi:hypothetical protein